MLSKQLCLRELFIRINSSRGLLIRREQRPHFGARTEVRVMPSGILGALMIESKSQTQWRSERQFLSSKRQIVVCVSVTTIHTIDNIINCNCNMNNIDRISVTTIFEDYHVNVTLLNEF